jgi:hypothetical protein
VLLSEPADRDCGVLIVQGFDGGERCQQQAHPLL